jgi:hypothetical protein
MAALAGVGSYGIVFHTKIARSSRRACNFMIPKGECAPAVFSIPIARSNSLSGCWQMLAGVRAAPGYRHESPGMTRFMNSSNMGTVKAVSP